MKKVVKKYGYLVMVEKSLKSGHGYWDTITCYSESEKIDCLNLASIYGWKVVSVRRIFWYDVQEA